jgi:hypothetical protein
MREQIKFSGLAREINYYKFKEPLNIPIFRVGKKDKLFSTVDLVVLGENYSHHISHAFGKRAGYRMQNGVFSSSRISSYF